MSGADFSLERVENDRTRINDYEELLLKRDQLFRESGSYMTSYTQEFGDMITENFKLKVECIKKKKTIRYCQRCMNGGLAIDTADMQAEIEREMTLYYGWLKEVADDNKRAKEAGRISEYRLSRAKKIYRRLIKILHPDINKKIAEDENLRELWEKIAQAYQRTDVDALDDLEVLVRREMEEMGDDSFELNLDDIEERIVRVENQINEILTTEPYTYGELLNDEEKKKARREKLQAEHDEYEKYLEDLKKTLDDMLKEGGVMLVWRMD